MTAKLQLWWSPELSFVTKIGWIEFHLPTYNLLLSDKISSIFFLYCFDHLFRMNTTWRVRSSVTKLHPRCYSWRRNTKCDWFDWLWVRSPLEEMKYSSTFIFTFLRSDSKAKSQRWVPPFDSGKSFCRPCCVRDTAWSRFGLIWFENWTYQ